MKNKTAELKDPKVPFNPYDPSFNLKEDAITFALIIISCFLQSLVISALYTPNHFLSGGVTGKFIYSKYGSYTSVAMAVDLGFNYWNDDENFFASLVAANWGGQIKPFGDKRERLPMDLRLGFTKQLENAPIRFSVTFVDLLRWKSSDYYSASGELSNGRIFTNHIVLGIDVMPMDVFYISAGYSFRRAFELKAAGAAHGAGLTCGAGFQLKRFNIGVAYAKYHVSMPALMLTAQYHL